MSGREIEALRAGDPRAIARALTAVENGDPSAAALLAGLGDAPAGALIVGVTGAPGAGKSTLADRLIAAYRGAGLRVGVLAVDPSSPFTGGAVLGDRVRMQGHAGDPGVFIRSMASRGQLGGLARTTVDAARILAAAGFSLVLIETVGVGQAEVDIAAAADLCIVVVAPGAGDEVQTLKAGLMEIADIFVVNKADREGADRTAAAITAMLSLQTWTDGAWKPPVLRTVATAGDGVRELVQAIDEFRRSRPVARRRPRPTPAGPPVRETVTLDHVGIATSDAGVVASVLRELFDLSTGPPETLGLHRLRFVETGAAAIELVEPLSPDAAVARFLKDRGAALHHVCLRVPDIDAALARLRAAGVRLIDEAPRPGAHGSRIAFLHPDSTQGILIEIKQPAN